MNEDIIKKDKKDSKILYFIRHGETEWNANHKIQGHLDISLNDKGREQANALGKYFVKIFQHHHQPFIKVYSSDLIRCKETTELILNHLNKIDKTSVKYDKRLRELDFGTWSGKTWNEIIEEMKSVENSIDNAYDEAFVFPKGESRKDLIHRVKDCVNEIVQQPNDNHDNHYFDSIELKQNVEIVIVVTHGGPIRALICDCFDTPISNSYRFVINNNSITRVSYRDGKFDKILSMNEVQHLH
ncbi:hypothetical protein ABK040_008178 [Willaertia magna]